MELHCAWCEKSMTATNGNQSLEEMISHGICLSCVSEMNLFDQININEENLKGCHFGIAVINIDNIILQYEAKIDELTILEPKDVIGKDYFKDINPILIRQKVISTLDELRTRNNDGQEELHFIIKNDDELMFSSLEITHFNNSGISNIDFKVLRREN